MSIYYMKTSVGRTSPKEGRISFPMLLGIKQIAALKLAEAYGLASNILDEYHLLCEPSVIRALPGIVNHDISDCCDGTIFSVEENQEIALIPLQHSMSEAVDEITTGVLRKDAIIAFPGLFGPWSELPWISRWVPEDETRLSYPMMILSRSTLPERNDIPGFLDDVLKDINNDDQAAVPWYFNAQREVAAYKEWADLFRRGQLVR